MSPRGANSTYFDQQPYLPPVAHQEHGLTSWDYQFPIARMPVRSEGRDFQYTALIASFSNDADAPLDDQISNLQREYGFPDSEVVKDFLVNHRAIRSVLQDAIPQLRETFGEDRIFNLEVSKDEDGCETMYAVAICRGDVRCAAEALHNFVENWWLRRMNAATSDLAFIYKLV